MKADSPSATAYLIADSTLALSKSACVGHLVPARAAELSARFLRVRSPSNRWFHAALRARVFRPFFALAERLTIPGIRLHYALRKLYLEETARAALGEGFAQLVVLGAGFDTLALRLHEDFPAAHFFEIDHPSTQRFKRAALSNNTISKNNLHFVPLDLARGKLGASLAACAAYRRGVKTLFVAEGLLMYLAPDEVEGLFSDVREQGGRGSRFAFTFMETRRDGRIAFRNSSRLTDAWLRLRGEPFKWGIERAQLAAYLAARGFHAREFVASAMLRRRYLDEKHLVHIALAEGECIAVAECD